MKKLLFLFSLILTLVSCSKNDSNIPTVTNNDVVGTWNLTDFKIEGTTKGTYKGQNFSGNVKSHGENYNFAFTFNQNNSLSLKGLFTIVTTSTILGVSQTNKSDAKVIDGFDNNAKWNIENNILKLTTSGGESFEIPIDDFQKDKIVLKYVVNEKKTINGIDLQINGIQYIVLEK
ncbi:hypothetical protein SAMN04487765_2949 [Tenacibaculum sp. MAR_2010_89]|uniref:hypothetical protein n=1 Tax=Tenacibaculum sp. MAR_2010_89 TaxID=1250198 RepID=UPI00089580EC|nr:hypothetical protein [Tenacibaculum sp. MAR_2010_89]SEE52614.1 hypothetical protein SAMN04487765_2949 [Tenacibaculum sp. MAR_2010_89]